jgi:hypothetical protein
VSSQHNCYHGLDVRKVVDISHKFAWNEKSLITRVRRLEYRLHLLVVRYGIARQISVLWKIPRFIRHD